MDEIEARMPVSPRRSRLCLAPLVVVLALLLSCGGDPDAGGGGTNPDASSGPITGFGSIFVNDVSWSIAGATIILDGVPGDASQLGLGMVVLVEGTLATGGSFGNAETVEFDDYVEGPLDANPIDLSPGVIQFSVFGVTIVAQDGVTTFEDGATLSNLMSGDFVEVSGLVDDVGALVATRVVLRPGAPTDAELKGTVSNLMRNISQFEIGPMTIVYDGSFQGTIFKGGLDNPTDLRDGQFVEVMGTLTNPTRIDAEVIELEPTGVGIQNSPNANVRGFVSNFVSNSAFRVSDVPVNATNATFEPPSLMLADGDYVEVEGSMFGGNMTATMVQRESLGDLDDNTIEIRATVPSGGIAAFGPNTLSMLNLEVVVDAGTVLIDRRDGVPQFAFSDLAEGDWLEILGNEDPNDANVVVATRLVRDDAEYDVVLQGPVTFVNPGPLQLQVLGRPVGTAVGSTFYDTDGTVLNQTTFFNTVMPDDIVRAVEVNAISTAALGTADVLSILEVD